MCGIVGSLGANGRLQPAALPEAVGRMAQAIGHRGPDDAGVWADPTADVVLGHRRLSVLDVSPAGHQPFRSRDGRLVLVYNGELYNHRVLRTRLEQSGVQFRGSSDTEVLVEAVSRWGLERTLDASNGMFAFALWDRSARTLTLATDRMGEKPLYYGWHRGIFLFASEIKALRQHPAFRPEVDRDALALFLRHTHVPAPYSIFKDTWKLPPGSVLTVRAGKPDTSVRPRPYWSVLDAALAGERAGWERDEGEALDELEVLLRDSVALRMDADVPYGALLSGGVDSSLLVALMQEQSPLPVRTFTIGFEEAEFDEAVHARAVAASLGTEHTELYLSAHDALDVIPRLPQVYDEPFADSAQIPARLVAELARRDVTVCLAGDGGDELFAGYARYIHRSGPLGLLSGAPRVLRHGVSAGLLAVPPDTWERLLRRVAAVRPGLLGQRKVGDKVHRFAEALAAPVEGDPYLRLMSQWQEPTEVVLDASEPATAFTASPTTLRRLGPAERMIYLDQVAYLPGDLLTKLDRATMSVSLEARVPFLDHRVVELSWQWPLELKIRRGVGKWPLRALLARRLPQHLVDRPKAGFSVPVADWLRGPLRDWAESLLDRHLLADQGYLAPEVVHTAWRQHLAGGRNREHELWAVLMFQSWLASAGGSHAGPAATPRAVSTGHPPGPRSG